MEASPQAVHHLGLPHEPVKILREGDSPPLGVLEDDREAVKGYRKAAEQGVALAQFNLGLMYYLGEGVLEDYVEAYAWFNLAAAQGDKEAVKGKDLLRSIMGMTAEQVAATQELAADLYNRIESSKSE